MLTETRRLLARVRWLALKAEVGQGGTPAPARYARVLEPLRPALTSETHADAPVSLGAAYWRAVWPAGDRRP